MTRGGRAPVYLWILFLGACAAIASQARFTTDLSAFLPRSPTPSQRILVDQLREGVVSQLILIGVDGAPPSTLVQISDALADRLARDPIFAYASNGAQARVEADGQFLLRNRYLLSPGVVPERFTAAGLRAALQEDLDWLASPLGSLASRVLPADPTGEFLRLLDLFQLAGGPQKRDGVWFSGDATRALLIAQTRAKGFDIDAQERALGRLRALFEEVSKEQGMPAAHMVATGPGVFAVATRAAIKQDVSRISLLAVLLVSCLLLIVYRSPRVLFLTLLPVVTGATAGIAAVSLVFGSVHGITLGFGATLLGEGVDYAIYLFTNAAWGRGSHLALSRLWRTLRLGVLTSVCGFGVMLLSDFSGLAQLGLFSIAGLIVAFAVTRLVLPHLAPTGYRAQPLAMLGPSLLRLAQAAPGLRYPLLVVVALCATWLAVRGDSVWNDRIESLSPVPEADKHWYERLQKDLGAPDARYLAVVSRATQQGALETAEQVGAVLERLQQAGSLAGFESPARILPSDRTQRQRQLALPDPAVLERNLSSAARGLPFRVERFQPFLEDVASAKRASALTRLDLEATGLKVRLDSLLAERGQGWIAMLSLRDVRDASAVAAALDLLHVDSVHLLDLKRETDELYRGYRGQALTFALVGAGAITVVLVVSLRSLQRTWAVMVPLVAALALLGAVFTLGGGQLGMFHLVGMLLVVGVGSNYALFFENQSAAGGFFEQQPPGDADPQATVVSLVLCNACTAIGFGLLALARAPVLSAIGVTVALGAFLSLAFSAVLARPVGR
jgi:predicted exporter